MSSIYVHLLGDIKVHDNNGDGVINLATDPITGLDDKPIPQDQFSSDPRIQYLLRMLGKDSIQGLAVSPAQKFMYHLTDIKRAAVDGNFSWVCERLPLLEGLAAQYGFVLSKEAVNKIYDDVFANHIRFCLPEIIRLVKGGEPKEGLHRWSLIIDHSLYLKTLGFGGGQRMVKQVWEKCPELREAFDHVAREVAREAEKKAEALDHRIEEGSRAIAEKEERLRKARRPEIEAFNKRVIIGSKAAADAYRAFEKRYGGSVDDTQEILGIRFEMDDRHKKILDRFSHDHRYYLLGLMAWIRPPLSKEEVNFIIAHVNRAIKSKGYLRHPESVIEAVIGEALRAIKQSKS